MTQWIDFKELRRELNFETVLKTYGVKLNIKATPQGRQHKGPCPLPFCKSKPGTTGFSANLTKGIWQCFTCKYTGNTLDFIVCAEGLDPLNRKDVRQAALIAKKKFLSKDREEPTEEPKAPIGKYTAKVVNEPLFFNLKSLDPAHAWFTERGLAKETVEHFGLGVCSRGWLKGRVAIPLQDQESQLIGYAGRLLDEKEVTEENPLYLFPEPRIYKGVLHHFDRSLVIYHGPKEPRSRILITREIETVWYLWQYGYISALSTMGPCCTGQVLAIRSAVSADGIAGIVAQDGEEDRLYTEGVMGHLMASCAVRWYSLPNRPLHSLDGNALRRILGEAE